MTAPKKCSAKLFSSGKDRIPLAVLSVLMTACFIMLAVCSVMFSGNTSKGAVPEPVFSKECGFYQDDFYLEIDSADGYDIYYTVDGSDPDENSIKYDQPILVQDASNNENVYSMRTDTSTGFYSDLIEAAGKQAPEYQSPDFLVDKCSTIRAVCISKDGLKSNIVTKSYFVGFDNKSGYDNMYVISIVTDPDNLFDYNNGIYVTGAAFDNFLKEHAGEKLDSKYWWWNANYELKGKDYERPASIELYDSDRDLLFSKNIGVRIKGGATRGGITKSLNFYARDEYDGVPYFSYDIFGTGYHPRTFTLYNGGDKVKLNDYLISSLVSDRAFSKMHFIPCAAFLDGEYWGVYWITEKYDETYVKYYYNLLNDDVYMIKNNHVEQGDNEGLVKYKAMRSFVIKSDMSIESNYEKACGLIDIESFIDYYAVESYIAHVYDWPQSNIALWRTNKTLNDAYSDSRWRWMLFDLNASVCSLDNTHEDTAKRLIEVDSFFSSLMKNPTFEKKYYQTLLELAEKDFDPESVKERFEYYESFMPENLKKEYERFFGKENTLYEDVLTPALEEMKQFLSERNAFIIDYCKSKLSGK